MEARLKNGPAVIALALIAWVASPPSAQAISPAGAVQIVRADVERLVAAGITEKDLHALRYYRLRDMDEKERAYVRIAFKLHINFLSRYVRIVDVVEVHPYVWRLDLREPKWDFGTQEAARFVDIFFHLQKEVDDDTKLRGIRWPGGVDSRIGKFFKKDIYFENIKAGDEIALPASWIEQADNKYLRETLYTETPILDAEWLMVQSVRQKSLANQQTGLGYYDFLRLKDRSDFFDLVKFREKDSLDKEIRAIAEVSGVSPGSARILAGFQSANGPVWVALDTNDPRKRGIALKNPDRGSFKHQIEEWYGALLNELPATFLSNEKGVRQDNAPADNPGFRDHSSPNLHNDGRIHVHLACLRCHAGQVLLPISDYYRKTFTGRRALGVKNDKERSLELQGLYLTDLDGKLAKDRTIFQDAFQRATVTPATPKGLTAQKAVEAYARVFSEYEGPVTVVRAAQELGVPVDEWKKALTWQRTTLGELDAGLAPLEEVPADKDNPVQPSLPINRTTWESVYPEAHAVWTRYALSGAGRKR